MAEKFLDHLGVVIVRLEQGSVGPAQGMPADPLPWNDLGGNRLDVVTHHHRHPSGCLPFFTELANT